MILTETSAKIATSSQCRLCSGAIEELFSNKVLGKYSVSYYKCGNCQCLQTEKPYWLDEAYKDNNLSNTDTGAARRNINNLAICYAISKALKLNNIIDIGGGDGLLCRLLRDYKINCFVKDKYAKISYAQGFIDDGIITPDLIIGFEVLEHYPSPMSELDELFGRQPRALLFSTAIFENENRDWWYLAPESGQHVFFYSRRAFAMIAQKYNYSLIIRGGYVFFVKNLSILDKILSNVLLSRYLLNFIKFIMIFIPPTGVWQDHLLQVEILKNIERKID